jgi:serine/threonine protein kinase
MGACWSAIVQLFASSRGYTEVEDQPNDVELGASSSSSSPVKQSVPTPVPRPTIDMSSTGSRNGSEATKSVGISVPRHSNSMEPLSSDFHRKYILRREIGSGSTSKVFDCLRKKDNKVFACKVINKAEIETNFSGLMDQFNLEIKVLKLLNHPHIIKLIDAFETSDSVYMVLEQCNGGELFDHVVDKGTLSEEEASSIIRSITSAVCHMHSIDIIHRDLKPENLLLTSPGKDAEVKLIDFGLAKIMQDDVARSFLGTRGYLAPEMLRRDAYDKSVDMWALGVIAFVLLCGCLPFDDDGSRISSESAARRKFTLRFPRWSANLSNSAKDLLYNLLDVDPKNRFTAEQALAHPWVKGQTVQPNNYLQSPSLLGKSRKDQRAKEAVALALSPKTSQMNSRLTQIKEESRAMNPRGNNGGQRSQNMTRADSM